jgi:hypothetical protein
MVGADEDGKGVGGVEVIRIVRGIYCIAGYDLRSRLEAPQANKLRLSVELFGVGY